MRTSRRPRRPRGQAAPPQRAGRADRRPAQSPARPADAIPRPAVLGPGRGQQPAPEGRRQQRGVSDSRQQHHHLALISLAARSRRVRALHRCVAASCQQTLDRDVLVWVLAMQAPARHADPALSALGRCCMQQSGKPRHRHSDRASVMQFDPDRHVVKPNPPRRSVHATPWRFRPIEALQHTVENGARWRTEPSAAALSRALAQRAKPASL
jgi:hypothetical protein